MKTESHIDDPSLNDNRNYDYSKHPDIERFEYPVILNMVKPGARVLDLGCGNGSLLNRLIKENNITAAGLEISDSGVEICQKRGLNVRYGRIDEHLPFENDSFDFAICNVTIQMVLYPEVLLREMKRVARYQIVSFPNFGHWRNRVDLLFNGRMPRRMLFEYSWYSTGHIHQLSFVDFQQLVDEIGGLRVTETFIERTKNPLKNYLLQHFPNLFQILAVVKLEKY